MSHTALASRRSPDPAERRWTLTRRISELVPFHYAAIMPALIATLAVIVVPLVFSFGTSFYHYILTQPREIHFDGFANYVRAFRDPTFADALRTTLIYGIGAVSAELVLGLAFASVVHTLRGGQGPIRTAMLVPIFMTPAVVAFMWRFILHGDLGILNYLTRTVGLGSPVWLGDPKLALVAVIVVDIWRNTPFMFLIYLAGMQSLPGELYEAASVDGATPWQQFTRLTLPLLRPLIMVSLIIRGMDALREFDTIYIMTGGGPGNATETIALATYRYSFRNYDMGLGSAVSYVIFAVVFVLSIIFVRRMQSSRENP